MQAPPHNPQPDPRTDTAEAHGLLRPGVLYMAASAGAFAAMSACVKLAGARLPSVEIVFVRALISLVLSLLLLRRAAVPLFGKRQHRKLLLLRGTCGFLGLSCVFYSVTHLPLAEATVLQYLHPIFVTILAAIFLAERVSQRHLLGIACAFGGMLLVVQPGSGLVDLPTFGVLIAILGAFFSGCAYTIVRRLASAGEHPLVIVLYFPLVTVPATLPFLWNTALWPTATEWILLAGVGIFAQIGQVTLTKGMQHEPAGRATVLSYLQVPIAAALGVLAFDEGLSSWTMIGALILLGGATLAAKRSRKPPPARAR